MNQAFDPTRTQSSIGNREGADPVRSDLDWCARCSKRLVGLSPALSVEQALDLASELSHDAALRLQSPECVAEDLERIGQGVDG